MHDGGLTLDGGCAGAVVEDGQFTKHLRWSHGAQLYALLRHLHLSICNQSQKKISFFTLFTLSFILSLSLSLCFTLSSPPLSSPPSHLQPNTKKTSPFSLSLVSLLALSSVLFFPLFTWVFLLRLMHWLQ